MKIEKGLLQVKTLLNHQNRGDNQVRLYNIPCTKYFAVIFSQVKEHILFLILLKMDLLQQVKPIKLQVCHQYTPSYSTNNAFLLYSWQQNLSCIRTT